MGPKDRKRFELALKGYHLATAEIIYRRPDYRSLLQTFVWQDLDLAPYFPVLRRFLDFWHRNLDGDLHSVRVAGATLVAPPEDPPRNETLLEGSHPLSGATVVNLSPAVAEELSAIGVPDSGVIIMELHRGTPAALMRFSPGDLVIAVNEHEIETVADLERALRDDTRDWRITVRRGSQLINMMARR